MDMMSNLKAFAATARTGSFSRAAREIGVATSVATKRVGQLESALRTPLFTRTTRLVTLTDAGRHHLPRVRALIAEYDATLAAMTARPGRLAGHLRIKAPTTLGELYIGPILAAFQNRHPAVSLEIVLIDGPVNPVESGFDMAIGAFTPTFGGVVDFPLRPLRRMLCAAPAYLAAHGAPRHPRDLLGHACLDFAPSGRVWTFTGPEGPVSVEVMPRLAANDGKVLLAAALAGNGIALLGHYLAGPALAEGRLVRVLAEYALPELLIKAVVPETKVHTETMRALLAWLTEAFGPAAPP